MKWKKIIDILPNKKTKLTAFILGAVNLVKILGVDIPDEVMAFINDVGIPALAWFLWMKIDREANGNGEPRLSQRSW